MTSEMGKLAIFVTAVTFFAFVVGVVGLIIPLWYTTELPEGTTVVKVQKKVYTGLWHTCTKTEYIVADDYSCDVILDTALDTHGLKAVQATTILGLALLCAVFVVLVVDLVCLDKKEWLSKVIGGIALLAGLCCD